jgi:acyl transferase domain-containing protein
MEPNSASIVAPSQDMDRLIQKLSSLRYSTKPVSVSGKFHSSDNKDIAQRLVRLCHSHLNHQLPDASKLLVPVFSNRDGGMLLQQPTQNLAIESVLVQLCNWRAVLATATARLVPTETPLVIRFGPVDCVPAAVIRNANATVVQPPVSTLVVGSSPSSLSMSVEPATRPGSRDDAIAVVGLGCKFPGADNLDEFWDLLSNGQSMCSQMPEERFKLDGLRRSDVKDIDAFDHKFFKKSSREAASMDPQQRILLQVAYQALESAGFFSSKPSSYEIGCYLGVCSTDYNDNVASNSPNAYSSLGTLRAFLSGKISHFFGFTGPSITYDTACSSSAVAIDAACKALQHGTCSMALAGGASLYTSPYFYQNLAAASFLSPTGPTKPFDSRGDGYCRGEGIGLVVLKRLADAVSDGDNILGLVSATAVNQNFNSCAITVPHSDSQKLLYEKVASEAGVTPEDVSFVEAHGTGTPVGDPIELRSIRRAFGGATRPDPLYVASVKGNVGHLEGASGVAALIKTILMMEHEAIPVQANHTQLNPKIDPLEPDRMIIPLATLPWRIENKVACINNYGAAGSNAAMIVRNTPAALSARAEGPRLPKYPLYIAANSLGSLQAYCRVLEIAIQKLGDQFSYESLLGTILFSLSQMQNRALPPMHLRLLSRRYQSCGQSWLMLQSARVPW